MRSSKMAPCEIYNMYETGLMCNAQVRRVYAPDPRLRGTVEDVTAEAKRIKEDFRILFVPMQMVLIKLSVRLLKRLKSPEVLKRLVISQIG
jgi:hypothetical protein